MATYGLHGVRWLAMSLVLVMAQMLSGMLAHAFLGNAVSASFLNMPVDWQGIFTVAGAEAAAIYCLLTAFRSAASTRYGSCSPSTGAPSTCRC